MERRGRYVVEPRAVILAIRLKVELFSMNNESVVNRPGLLGEEVGPNILK